MRGSLDVAVVVVPASASSSANIASAKKPMEESEHTRTIDS